MKNKLNAPKKSKKFKINWEDMPINQHNNDLYTKTLEECTNEVYKKSNGTIVFGDIYELIDTKLDIINGILTLKSEKQKIIIGGYEITKSGKTSWKAINTETEEKTDEESGEVETVLKDSTVTSHGCLRWCLQTITRLGNEGEQARAKETLGVYEVLLNENKIIDNDKHMEKYREIEENFFLGFGVQFDIVDGEIQNKLF